MSASVENSACANAKELEHVSERRKTTCQLHLYSLIAQIYCKCEDLRAVNITNRLGDKQGHFGPKMADGSDKTAPGTERARTPTGKGETKIATEKPSEIYPLGGPEREVE